MTKNKRYMVILNVSKASYVVCGCYNNHASAVSRAQGLLTNGCKAVGEKITVSVYDSTKKWSDKKAWNNFTWND